MIIDGDRGGPQVLGPGFVSVGCGTLIGDDAAHHISVLPRSDGRAVCCAVPACRGGARFAFNQCLRIVKTALTQRRTAPGTEVPWTGFDLINAFNAWKKTQDAGRVFTVDSDGMAETTVTGLAWRGEVCQQVFEEAGQDSRPDRHRGPERGGHDGQSSVGPRDFGCGLVGVRPTAHLQAGVARWAARQSRPLVSLDPAVPPMRGHRHSDDVGRSGVQLWLWAYRRPRH